MLYTFFCVCVSSSFFLPAASNDSLRKMDFRVRLHSSFHIHKTQIQTQRLSLIILDSMPHRLRKALVEIGLVRFLPRRSRHGKRRRKEEKWKIYSFVVQISIPCDESTFVFMLDKHTQNV